MRKVLFFCLLLMLYASPAFSVEEETGMPEGQLSVSAERLEADEKSRSITLEGGVVARQAGMVMYAEKMVLYYLEGTRDIGQVEISGGLRIVQEDRLAIADQGLFQNSEGKVLLKGNAEVHQGGNSIVGDEIVYFLNEERSVVKSQPESRVNAIFRPGSTE